MLELVINNSFSTVFEGPAFTTPSDAALYVNGSASNIVFTTTEIVGTNMWTVTFTPTTTGVFTFYAFGEVKFRAQCFDKSPFAMLSNLEDEALGSWNWNKSTGTLTVLRQNGAALAIHKIIDSQTESSRERIN